MGMSRVTSACVARGGVAVVSGGSEFPEAHVVMWAAVDPGF